MTTTMPSAPPGWYHDPFGAAPWRWWNGCRWTEHVWPLPAGGQLPWADGPRWVDGAPLGSAPSDAPLGRAIGASIGWILVAMLAGVGVAIVPAVAAAIIWGESGAITAFVVAFYPAMFFGFWLAARKISKRHGTDDIGRDFGWMRFRAADIGWGILAGLAALVAQIAIAVALPQPDDDSYRDSVFGEDPSALLLLALGAAIVIGAPLFEELVFRGPVLRSFVARCGAAWGIVLQGAVFSVYHVVGNPALIRGWYLVPLFAVGVIFGFTAHRTQRLAAAQIAHALMNSIAFVALLTTL